jgi:flagellar basal body rod protein FlgG
MHYGMYLSAAGAASQSQRLEVINHNIANVGTTGFKRELGLLQARAAEAIEQGLEPAGTGTVNDLGGGVRLQDTTTDFTQGPLRKTLNDTDFALAEPNAFFVVQQDGEDFLTRAGNFHFNSAGELVTDHGHRVLSSDGTPIQIDPLLPFSVNAQGAIVQAGEAKPLATRRPAAMGDLVRLGDNLFASAGTPPVEIPENERSVKGGYLEMSAVQPHAEMMRLIETTRAYEANVRMIQNHDTALGNLLGRILRAS